MDALKPLIHSGMEVDSSHRTRFVFLQRCIHIFLIRVHDHEKVSLQNLFSPYLIASLHPDLQQHIEKTLKVDLNQDDISDTTRKDANHTGSAVTINIETLGEEADTNTIVPTDAFVDVDADADRISDEYLDPGSSTSGFRLNSSVPKWNKQKCWNYIDAMLEQIRESVREASDGNTAVYEDAYHKAMVDILQLDLQEFPGCYKVPTLSKAMQPAWQEMIQKKLLW
ncbi:hypothetical protein EV424DRAFT_1542023 [Suillus variegatus]|nr:hypothetical protein EV424DRAFT_1542023 [Suillus variegatus]